MYERPQLHKTDMHAIKDEFKQRVADIRADKRYSAEGQRNAIAALYRDAKAQSAALKAKYDAATTDYRQAVERDLYGLPAGSSASTIQAWRDAQDRVDGLPDEAACARAFERYRRGGDEQMMRAIMQRAARHGWYDMVREADTEFPGSLEQIKALEALNSPRDHKLVTTAVYGITRPTELGAAQDDTISRWADEAAPPAAPPMSVGIATSYGAGAVA